MLRTNKQLPELDVLDSPLISANPFGSFLNVVPRSALAERIFNDPESWQGTARDDGNTSSSSEDSDLEDPMAWLADELEQYNASGDQFILSPVDRRDSISTLLQPLTEKLKFDDNDLNKRPFLPPFDHTPLDLSLNMDLRLSKIWDAKQAPVSTANNTKPTSNTNIPPALNLDAPDKSSPMASPLAVASASTTWSILEWYGVQPGTPRLNPAAMTSTKPPPVPPLRRHVSPSPPSLPLPTPPRKTTTLEPATSTITPIRRLPVIPPSRSASPPTRSTSPSPSSSSLPTTPPTQRSQSVPIPTLQYPHGAPSFTASPAPSLSRTPSVSDLNTSLFVRSPPAGPRPRSGTTPVKHHHHHSRQMSTNDLPSPFFIGPASGYAPLSRGGAGRGRLMPLPSLPAGVTS